MFYLVLPSNSSFDFYPHNTLTNYTTRLPNDVELNDDWEVGLEEIQYTHSWPSFQLNDVVKFAYASKYENSEEGVINWYHHIVDVGYYADKGELISSMEKALPTNEGGKVIMSWNKITDVVTMQVDEGAMVKLSPKLQELLGFNKRGDVFSKGVYFSLADGTLNQDITALYVYCDLIRPRVVGDSRVSLLRPVPVTGDHNKNVFLSFTNIHYLPLNTFSFNSVEIDIRDDTGKHIPFGKGRTVVTLHFRKKGFISRR
jgi:hypothetical protein